MITMTELVQYLLAYTTPGGGRLCRHGIMQTTILAYPPGAFATWTIGPQAGAYASIHYYREFSPAMVPNTFWIDFAHAGLAVSSGFIGATALAHGVSHWMVITDSQVATQSLTNLTGLNQLYETVDYFLIVSSEVGLTAVEQLIREYSSSSEVTRMLEETNRLLGLMAGAPPGQPQPPII